MVSGGMSCVKYLLFAFNLVFVIFGIILLYAGFSTVAKIGHYEQLLEDAPNNVAVALIIVGFAIFLVAFLGCCGAIRENSCMLTTFSAIILVILLIEVIGAGLIFAFKSKLREAADEGIKKAIREYSTVNNETAINKVLDDIQSHLFCCGANNASDWALNDNITAIAVGYLPDSCCYNDTLHNQCKIDDKVYYYHKGCVEALDNEIRSSFGLLGGIAIAIAVIQLIGILFGCSLSRSIKKEYEVV